MLNALQAKEGEEPLAQSSESDQRIAVSLKELKRRANALSELDAACGPTKAISFLARERVDLDYTGGTFVKGPDEKLDEIEETRAFLFGSSGIER